MERFSARAVHLMKVASVPNSPSLQDLLTNTCQMLHDILKAIADTDHLEVMLEIESLVALAHKEAARMLRGIKLRI
jgi:hypothetical protein